MTTTNIPLARLQPVDLRKVWQTEAGCFTPWLASGENISLLGGAIGLELEVEAQEKDVGPFRADILCKDTANDHWVLIENQLDKTDHTHLGQLLTYAAGLQVVTIVWIAQQFTEEHRAARDWLNENTYERFNFFGLEMIDETGVALSKLIPKSGRKSRWIYEYDFGDGLQHEVLFEGFVTVDPKVKYPICVEGARACPPEDCGGPWGYADYLAAIAHPQHERHEELLECGDRSALKPSIQRRRQRR
jgi:hypothetical protein